MILAKVRERSHIVGLGFLLSCYSLGLSGQTNSEDLSDILSQSIRIERNETVTSVPFKMRSGMPYIDATINDFTGEFVFDTGSPTVVDQTVAKKLGLRVIGENIGRDANGKEVTMKIAVADSISLGGTVFFDVPVMVYDYSSIPLGPCYLPNGVLGSELLPGGVWRMDMTDASLQIAANVEHLEFLGGSKKVPLHTFGYPFAPIVDYSIGRFSDKALFDTGYASQLALFGPIEQDKRVQKQIDRSTIERGRGRLGTSAGGVGDVVPLRTFQLKSLKIGDYRLENVSVQTRQVPPTLIGAGLLNSHIVTLDYVNAEFSLSPFPSPPRHQPRPGFSLHLNGDKIEVAQVFDSFSAKNSGLLLGDQIVEIDGFSPSLSTEDERCEASRWLSDQLDLISIKSMKISRNGESREIILEKEPD